jgi:hypothetical protein
MPPVAPAALLDEDIKWAVFGHELTVRNMKVLSCTGKQKIILVVGSCFECKVIIQCVKFFVKVISQWERK